MIDLPILDDGQVRKNEKEPTLWRSFPQLTRDASFQKLAQQEFKPGASEPPGSGPSRRQFLQMMGASMAMMGLSACRRPVEPILPYARKPEEIIPGIPLFYATAIPRRGSLLGLLVESHEGRPTKVEGNREHPASRGATDAYAQGSIYTLYDPDRSKQVLRAGEAATWEEFAAFWSGEFSAQAATRRVAVLAEPTSSPTLRAVRAEMAQRFPNLRWVTYRPEGDDPISRGMQAATGRPLRPAYDFSQARVIVSLDADFLDPRDPNTVQNTQRLIAARDLTREDNELLRLYVVESSYTLTGGKADNRLRLRASEIPAFAAALASRLGLAQAGSLGAPFADHPWVAEIAQDLRRVGSGGVVLAGETQPPEIHALCAAINQALGSTIVSYLDTGDEPEPPLDQQVQELVTEMRAGRVDALVVLGTNPVYSLPAEYDFAAAMERVPVTVHANLWIDETAQVSAWHLPLSHYLEMWGDGRSYEGVLSIIQPLIAPLYETKSEIEVLNLLATGTDRTGYDLVRETWRGLLPDDFETGWRRVLHDGLLPESSYPRVASPGVQVPSFAAVPAANAEAIEVVFRLDSTLFDGFYANNPWMQELPDPVTQVSWDNVALMSLATAEQLGLSVDYEDGFYMCDLVDLELEGRTVRLPVWIMPGLPKGSITVNFGYGRNIVSSRPARKTNIFDLDEKTDVFAMGPVANGVGANVYPLRSARMERVALGAQVRRVGERYHVSTYQDHGVMEGRPIVRFGTVEEYRANPDFANDMVEPIPGMREYGQDWSNYPPLWEEDNPYDQPEYKDNLYHKNQWGMAIDLDRCTGCKACVIACNTENNIPVVGKEAVAYGRDMLWLRVDRYFVSEGGEDPDDALMVTQPVPCMHCETAPCESVCPVAATSHSADGINEMTYNRCIGTRYCSNNCPYKVRRFNFFNWTKTLPETFEMGMNPDVTIRFRGVMEKCTYCVQRIRETQRQATIEERPVEDQEVLTACAQACPAEAITFGDLTDPNSAVSRHKRDPRNYALLAELDTKPRTSYLARIMNPNQRLLARTAAEETDLS